METGQQPASQESRSLVKTAALANTALVTLSPQQLDIIRNDYLAKSRHQDRMGHESMSLISTGLSAGMLTLALSGAFHGRDTDFLQAMCYFFGPVFGALGSVITWQKAGAHLSSKNQERGELRAAGGKLRDEFRMAQTAAYRARQSELVKLADEHLSMGKKLDLETLSYLAAVPTGLLKPASDNLAISVLQVRAMLAHLDSKGRKPLAHTFASCNVNPESESARQYLRVQLEGIETALSEDAPELKDFELPPIPDAAMGWGEAMARRFVPYYYTFKDRREFSAATLPAVPSVETPALRKVENLEKRLQGYELAFGEKYRLDMPAVNRQTQPVAALNAPAPLI